MTSDAAPPNDPAPAPPPRRRRKLLRRVLYASLALIVTALLAVELVGRFYFGLCDPPLLSGDPELEYILQPNQQTRQFGKRVIVNEYSMRAPSLPRKKTNPAEFRVMVLGDSVVYGGSKVDQDEVATTRLQRALSEKLARPVVVGNISAGSWGPPNLLAYVRRFGWFDADVVVIVVSKQDYDDAMTFEPMVDVDPSFPSRKPRLALKEIATRYLPRYLAIQRQAVGGVHAAPTTAPINPESVATAMGALSELIRAAKVTGARVIVAQHPQVPELVGQPFPEQAVIADVARQAGADDVVPLAPAMKQSVGRGEEPYRDYIHPTAAGQRVISEVLTEAILSGAWPSSSPSATRPTVK